MIQYAFSRAEDFSVCDALSLTLAVTDQKGNLIPAKVRLTLYGADVRIEAGCTLQTGKLTTVTLSGIPLDAADACTSMTLSVQPLLAQEDGNLRVYLLDIDGMSRTLDDDALEAAILEKREERAKQESRRPMGAYPVLLLTALVLLTAVGAVFCLRGSMTSGEYIDQLVLARISPRCSMELPAAKPQGGRSHIAHERAFHQHDLTIEGHDAGQQRQMQHAAGLQPLVHNRKQQ